MGKVEWDVKETKLDETGGEEEPFKKAQAAGSNKVVRHRAATKQDGISRRSRTVRYRREEAGAGCVGELRECLP